MPHADTIVAAATPQGRGALAILRISGPNAFPISAKCLFEKSSFEKAPPRSSHLYKVKDPESGHLLDEVTIIKYAAQRSFTGEDLVEIVCHGGPRMVNEITAALLGAGCRGARRGEFTRRALENGKLDLMHAEAIRGMIESESEAALECARKLFSAEGHRFRQWRKELIEIAAQVEATIEFEEDIDRETILYARQKIESFLSELSADIRKKEQVKVLEKGMRVVIAGPANAGKSSLFNLLLGFGRSIVHREPGTTRDLVSETVCIGSHDVVLVDSAGLRESVQEVELAGMGLTRKAISDSGAVIWVTPADEKSTEDEMREIDDSRDKMLLIVVNKIDRSSGDEKLGALKDAGFDAIPVSVKEGINCEELFATMRQKIADLYAKVEIPDLLFNERQEELGKALQNEIKGALAEWNRAEIAAHCLKKAIACLDEFFGTTNPEEVMNLVFEKFCIGK